MSGRYVLLLFEFHDHASHEEIWRYAEAIGNRSLELHDGIKSVSIEGPRPRPKYEAANVSSGDA